MRSTFTGLEKVPVNGGYREPDKWVWCGSAVEEHGNGYHLYASRWRKDYPMLAGYVLFSEIVHAFSKTVTGPYHFIEKILPIIDNFERGLATVPPEKQEDPFVDGMNRIYKQFLSELDKIGVKPIEAVGKEFDPNLHNAVMQVDSEEYEAGTVAQELQKGYTYRDSVVRHSMVGVVRD